MWIVGEFLPPEHEVYSKFNKAMLGDKHNPPITSGILICSENSLNVLRSEKDTVAGTAGMVAA